MDSVTVPLFMLCLQKILHQFIAVCFIILSCKKAASFVICRDCNTQVRLHPCMLERYAALVYKWHSLTCDIEGQSVKHGRALYLYNVSSISLQNIRFSWSRLEIQWN